MTEAYEEYSYAQKDAVNHIVTVTTYPNAQKCLDCGAFLEDKDEGTTSTYEEPHIKWQFSQEYNDYFDYSYFWWDASNGYERPYDIEVHCADCGYNYQAPEEEPGEVPGDESEEVPGDTPEEVPGDTPEEEPGDEPEVVPEHEHVWVACKHESKYTAFYGSTTYSWKTKKGVVDKKVHIATPVAADHMESACATCGKVFVNHVISKKSYEQRHSFENGVCTKCGYVSDCTHANAREVIDVNFYATKFINTNDLNMHTVDGTYSVRKVCPDCGIELKDQRVEYTNGTAPHKFNDAGICQLCGYARAGVAAVALSIQKTKQLAVGETWDSASVLNIAPKTATGVAYTSGNKKIFEVDASGKITAKKAGKAKLTVKCGKLKAVCTVTVKKASASITLPPEKTMGVGQKLTLAATFDSKNSFANVSYTSGNPDCVVVLDAATGEIMAVSAGTANITASIMDGKSTAKCAVTVSAAPNKVSLDSVPKQMGKGEKLTVEPKLLDAEGKEAPGYVRFMSSNTKVLKIGEYDGALTAVGTGTAKIFAFAYNGVQASVDIEVKNAPRESFLPRRTRV